MRVALIGCSATKLEGRHPARRLYTGDLFSRAVAYAESTCDRWAVLSAWYGLVLPDTVIESYDHSLRNVSAAARRVWGGRTTAQIRARFDRSATIVVLAGEVYREHLDLEGYFARVDVPLRGLGIGHQKSALRRMTGGAA